MAKSSQKIISQNKSLGLYVHIPFCRSKCEYCDFYSLPRSSKTPELMDRYVKALETHIREGGAEPPNMWWTPCISAAALPATSEQSACGRRF